MMASSTSTTTPVSTAGANTFTSVSAIVVAFENVDILQKIVSFVGAKQYRFVAAVNPLFREAYLSTFPGNKVTRLNASTEAHARICWDELDHTDSAHRVSLCASAARHGNLSVLQFFFANYGRKSRFLHILRWHRKNKSLWDELTCSNAALNGHWEVLQWCREKDCPWDVRTCSNAARNGHLDILKWCRKNGCPWDEFTCAQAARNGHLNVLQWCREKDCPWDKDICAWAAGDGHLNVLQWCRENGSLWDEMTCKEAAEGGQLNVLQWCRENGCPWDKWTCCSAALNGHLHILQWCRENGCPWDGTTCAAAVAKGHSDVLQWSRDNGCPDNCVCILYGGSRYFLRIPSDEQIT